MSQNAFLHLGMCYLKADNKAQARMAFEQASLMSYNKEIQEEALYNYALATYELSFSPFNESVKAFETFLDKYPNSKHTDDVHNYLVNVYLTTNNHEAAYESIEKIKRPSAKIYEAKARILYNMGINEFTAQNYDKAIESYKKASELNEKDSLEISLLNNGIFLKKEQLCCIFCNSHLNLIDFNNKKVCKKCLNNIKTIV